MLNSKKDSDYNDFFSKLEKACKAMNDMHYFAVKEAAKDDADKSKKNGCKRLKYKERVYCYELYHRMRSLQESSGYVLDGELDKSGHPLFSIRYKPDFVVHDPGNMDDNLVVIEVKPIDAEGRNLKKDLDKLKEFINKYEYPRGIMLLYSNDDIKERRLNRIKSILGEYPKEISVLIHPGPGRCPVEINQAIEYRRSGLPLP